MRQDDLRKDEKDRIRMRQNNTETGWYWTDRIRKRQNDNETMWY
jgi:hypothetical protein